MTFACILALMGIWAFVLSENILCLIPVIVSIGIATREFEDLKEKVEWLEIKLGEYEKNVRISKNRRK